MRYLKTGIVALLALAAACAVVHAQTVPDHVDPSARDGPAELATVAALRFLTTPDYPPFNYRGADGGTIGFHVDLARAICEDLRAVCTIQTWPWDQIADALAENQGDAMIGGLAIDPISGDRFDFSSIYLAFPARFVGTASAAANFDPRNLAGKSVAVRKGSRHKDFIARFSQDARIVEYASEFDALDAVREAKADLYFGDALRASFWLNQHAQCCGFLGDAYFRPDYFGNGLAIAVPAGGDNVRAAIDLALVRLKKSGRMDELYLRWFPVSFY